MDFASPEVTAWVVAGVVSLAIATLLLTLRHGMRRWQRRAAQTPTVIDDIVSAAFGHIRVWAVVAGSLLVGLQIAPIPADARDTTLTVLIVLVMLQTAWCFDAGVRHGVQVARNRGGLRQRAAVTTLSTVGFLAKVGVWFTALILVLSNLGVDVTALVTTLGIGGLAVALALQNFLGDMVASIAIVGDRPFVEGDFIEVGDFSGVVEQIGLKTTRLRSAAGEQVIFPNSDLISSRVANHGRITQRRAALVLHIPLDTPAAQLEGIPVALQSIVRKTAPQATFKRAYLMERTSTCFVFELQYKMPGPDYDAFRATHQAINIEVQRWLESRSIPPAYPARTLHVKEGAPVVPAKQPRIPRQSPTPSTPPRT